MASASFIVTGANGWLGKRFTRLLATRAIEHPLVADLPDDLRISCLVLPGEDADELKALGDHVTVIEGDIRNPDDCRKLVEGQEGAIIVHTAGIIHPRKVSDFYAINTEGTKNLLEAAQTAKLKRFVAVSSNSPLGCNPHSDHSFDESSPYNPYMGYGKSKMAMEDAVKKAAEDSALETVIIRPPWFYGPDQPPRQTLFFSMIRSGKVPVVGSGLNRRSMGYVDNLCQGLFLAAVKDEAVGQTYWIADDEPYDMNTIVDTIERVLERDFQFDVAHKRMRIPGVVGDVAGIVDGMLQGVGLYHQKIHVLGEMNKTIACSIDKAKDELGYQPSVSLEEGMKRSIAWCLENGHSI